MKRNEQQAHQKLYPINKPFSSVQQQRSYVAEAASWLVSHEVAIPIPVGMRRPTTPSGHQRRKTFRKMSQRQSVLIQEAFYAANSLLVLEGEHQLDRLERAEVAELTDNAMGKPGVDDTLPPRAMAMTVMHYGKAQDNHQHILDATAFVATNVDDDHPVPAVKDTRIAFMVGPSAVSYAMRHQSNALKTRSAVCGGGAAGVSSKESIKQPSVCHGGEVCLTWCEPMLEAGGGEKVWRMRSEFLAITFQSTADEYVNEICNAATRLWSLSGVVPRTRIVAPYRTLGAEEAYVQSVETLSKEFQSLVYGEPTIRTSYFVNEDPDYCGKLDFSDIFLKIAPKASKKAT